MKHYEASAHLTKVGVNMGDHGQDVVRALHLPRWKTVGDILDEYLGDDPETFVTIRAVRTPKQEYDVSLGAFENACAEQAPEILDDVAMWPHGYDDQGAELVRHTIRRTFESAGLTVDPGFPPKPEQGSVAF